MLADDLIAESLFPGVIRNTLCVYTTNIVTGY